MFPVVFLSLFEQSVVDFLDFFVPSSTSRKRLFINGFELDRLFEHYSVYAFGYEPRSRGLLNFVD